MRSRWHLRPVRLKDTSHEYAAARLNCQVTAALLMQAFASADRVERTRRYQQLQELRLGKTSG